MLSIPSSVVADSLSQLQKELVLITRSGIRIAKKRVKKVFISLPSSLMLSIGKRFFAHSQMDIQQFTGFLPGNKVELGKGFVLVLKIAEWKLSRMQLFGMCALVCRRRRKP